MNMSWPFIFIFMPARVRLGHRLIPILQPLAHQTDLRRLRHRDAPAKDLERLARAVRLGPLGHLHGLRVVADHARHELDVGGGVRATNAVDARLLDARHGTSLRARAAGPRGAHQRGRGGGEK